MQMDWLSPDGMSALFAHTGWFRPVLSAEESRLVVDEGLQAPTIRPSDDLFLLWV